MKRMNKRKRFSCNLFYSFISNVLTAANSSKRITNWKNTNAHTPMRSHFNAQLISVRKNSVRKLVCCNTKPSIQVNSSMRVACAAKASRLKAIWKCIWRSTIQRKRSNVRCATSHSKQSRDSSITRIDILGLNRTNAVYATNDLSQNGCVCHTIRLTPTRSSVNISAKYARNFSQRNLVSKCTWKFISMTSSMCAK